MPRATLEFQLPEESDEHRFAIRGADLYCAVAAYLETLRQMEKSGYQVTTEESRRLLAEALIERDLSWILG